MVSVSMMEQKRSTFDLDESDKIQDQRLHNLKQKKHELLKIQDLYEDAEAGDQEFTLGCMRT